MVDIPKITISKSGDLHYVAIPIDLINCNILKRNKKYHMTLTEIPEVEGSN